MIISNTKSNIYFTKSSDFSSKSPYLFIHGFTGSSASWKDIYNNLNHPYIAIDVPGHGDSNFHVSSDSYSINDFSSDLKNILNLLNINKIKICGYSMGARLAILFAKKYPDMIETLFLESAMAGIIDDEKRNRRLVSDYKLANEIKNNFNTFLHKWESLDLFKTQLYNNTKGWEEQKLIRKSHHPTQLSRALKIFSQGKMPLCQSFISETSLPIILINGKLDKKFIQYSNQLCSINKSIKHYIISNASHNVHLENPIKFLNIIKN